MQVHRETVIEVAALTVEVGGTCQDMSTTMLRIKIFLLADNQSFCAGRNMGCSSVVTTPDEVSIEVDEDVVMPAELTITRNTRTTELIANLHAIRLFQASVFHCYVMSVCISV